jgi:hypothetical protein
MDSGIRIKFANGTYLFRLLWPQLLELERNCGRVDKDGSRIAKSVFTIFNEMAAMSANAIDIKETIRLGLIGGGEAIVDGQPITVGALTAAQLTEDYIFPLNDARMVAEAILYETIAGVELKKKTQATDKPKTKRTVKAKS